MSRDMNEESGCFPVYLITKQIWIREPGSSCPAGSAPTVNRQSPALSRAAQQAAWDRWWWWWSEEGGDEGRGLPQVCHLERDGEDWRFASRNMEAALDLMGSPDYSAHCRNNSQCSVKHKYSCLCFIMYYHTLNHNEVNKMSDD